MQRLVGPVVNTVDAVKKEHETIDGKIKIDRKCTGNGTGKRKEENNNKRN